MPGRGSNLIMAGKIPVTINGNASPRPMVRKTKNKVAVLLAKAKAKALPKTGALQGVAKIVANTPLAKSPSAPVGSLAPPKTAPPGV